MSKEKSAYRWARSYIKLVRILACLCLLAGALWITGVIWDGILNHNKTQYTASPVLLSRYENVRDNYHATIEIMRQKNINIVNNSGDVFTEINRKPATSEEFEKYMHNVDDIKSSIDKVKTQFYAIYSQPIDSLIATLSEHASKLRSELGENGVKGTGAPLRRHAQEGEQSSAREDSTSKIYSTPSDEMINNIQLVKKYYLSLQSQTTKDKSKQLLGEAIQALDLYIALIKGEIPVQLQRHRQLVRTEPDETTPVRTELKVDELIDMLASTRTAVQNSILNGWNVSNAFGELLSLAHSEHKECQARETAGHQIIVQTIFQVLKLLVTTLVLTFLILVIADFLQAIIDTPDLLRKIAPSDE